jgi:hypothetical protein
LELALTLVEVEQPEVEQPEVEQPKVEPNEEQQSAEPVIFQGIEFLERDPLRYTRKFGNIHNM